MITNTIIYYMRYYRYFCTDYCSKWPSEYQFSQSQPFQLLVPWGQDKLEDSVISGPGTLETSEDLVISAYRDKLGVKSLLELGHYGSWYGLDSQNIWDW